MPKKNIIRLKFLVTSLVCLASLLGNDIYSQNAKRTDSIHIAHYTLKLSIMDFENKTIEGEVLLSAVPLQKLSDIELDLLQLQTDSVKVNGKSNDFVAENNKIKIPLDSVNYNIGDTLILSVFYKGKTHEERFGGFYFSGNYAFNIGVSTQSIPHSFGKTWFPCIDEFTDKSSYTFKIHTLKNHKAVCNGLLTDSTSLPDGSIIWTWEQKKVIPAYLASVAVGDYYMYKDSYKSINGRDIPIRIYVFPNMKSYIQSAFERLKSVLKTYENMFGVYPFERIGYVAVNLQSGAMEHVCNISYPADFIKNGKIYESVCMHELSHSWFGNLVTCETEEDMWLNEGFASYCESVISEYFSDTSKIEASYSEKAYREWFHNNHVNVLKYSHIKDKDYLPLYPMPKDKTYGSTTYEKGAIVIYSLRSYMGDSLFYECIKSYLQEYAFKNVNSADFFKSMSQKSGMNLMSFYDAWVNQPGFLHFSVDSIVNTTSNEYNVYLKQKLHHAKNFANNNKIDVSFFFPDKKIKTVENLSFSGKSGMQKVKLEQRPLFVVADYHDKYADAIIDTNIILNNEVKNINFNNGDCMLSKVKSEDGILRIEHNLVAADSLRIKNQHIRKISETHYWRIVYNDTNMSAEKIYFAYNALDSFELDYKLAEKCKKQDYVLLYRKNPSYDWKIIPYTQVGTVGKGFLVTDKLKMGEYCIGIGDTAGMAIHRTGNANNIKIYPNPAKDKINIQSEDSKIKSVEIYDENGKKLQTLNLTSDKMSSININKFSPGMYFFIIHTDKEIISKNIVLY